MVVLDLADGADVALRRHRRRRRRRRVRRRRGRARPARRARQQRRHRPRRHPRHHHRRRPRPRVRGEREGRVPLPPGRRAPHAGAGGGAILNLASIASVVGIPDRFAYSMSKGAVLTMTYSVATDYLDAGIRCNAISPARVHTPFVDRFLADSYPGREAEMFAHARRPPSRSGAWPSRDEIAALAAYLCSDEAAFVTGSNHLIDGGFTGVRADEADPSGRGGGGAARGCCCRRAARRCVRRRARRLRRGVLRR